jgi:hypothetical protein
LVNPFILSEFDVIVQVICKKHSGFAVSYISKLTK